MVFLRHCLTVWINHSQKPPHHGAFSTMNFQLILLFAKYRRTSFDRTIFLISLDAPLKVFALSEIKVAGRPLWLVNLRKASREHSTVRFLVNSKCTAPVVAQVNKQM